MDRLWQVSFLDLDHDSYPEFMCQMSPASQSYQKGLTILNQWIRENSNSAVKAPAFLMKISRSSVSVLHLFLPI